MRLRVCPSCIPTMAAGCCRTGALLQALPADLSGLTVLKLRTQIPGLGASNLLVDLLPRLLRLRVLLIQVRVNVHAACLSWAAFCQLS